jgi:hypothetical protein
MAACYGDELGDVDPIARIIIEAESGRRIVLGDAEMTAPVKVVSVPRQCSPTEESILKVLVDGAWHTSQEIADAIRMNKNNGLMIILGNMAEAGMIESSTRTGYRLPPARETEVANGE